MQSADLNLAIFYLGFTLVLVLAWAAVMSDLIEGEPPRWTYRATAALRVLGLFHPAAAIAAWDLRHQLAIRTDPEAGRESHALVIFSLVVAGLVLAVTSRL